LICPRWEEAIIRENQAADLPFEIMQQHTIDMVTSKDNPIEQTTSQQSII